MIGASGKIRLKLPWALEAPVQTQLLHISGGKVILMNALTPHGSADTVFANRRPAAALLCRGAAKC